MPTKQKKHEAKDFKDVKIQRAGYSNSTSNPITISSFGKKKRIQFEWDVQFTKQENGYLKGQTEHINKEYPYSVHTTRLPFVDLQVKIEPFLLLWPFPRVLLVPSQGGIFAALIERGLVLASATTATLYLWSSCIRSMYIIPLFKKLIDLCTTSFRKL